MSSDKNKSISRITQSATGRRTEIDRSLPCLSRICHNRLHMFMFQIVNVSERYLTQLPKGRDGTCRENAILFWTQVNSFSMLFATPSGLNFLRQFICWNGRDVCECLFHDCCNDLDVCECLLCYHDCCNDLDVCECLLCFHDCWNDRDVCETKRIAFSRDVPSRQWYVQFHFHRTKVRTIGVEKNSTCGRTGS